MFSWIIIFGAAVWAVWFFGKNNDRFLPQVRKESPIDILKRRFANGEITEAEYDEKMAILEEDEFFIQKK